MKGTMNEPHKFQELNWRRTLPAAEQDELRAALAKNPEALAEFESEVGLTYALGKLPAAPMSSNFTARVLQAVELESKRAERNIAPRWLVWLRSGWIPKLAFASLMVCAGMLSYHQHDMVTRKNLARDMAAISVVVADFSPEDLAAIRNLDKAKPDIELLALYK